MSFVDASADEKKLLLWAGSDSDPGRFYLFNKDTKGLTEIMPVRPQLDKTPLATMKPVTFPAADGTMIPAYLTLPPGSDGKNLPAIVLPHGGPDARDEWEFSWLPQFFANRGFAVLQPNYRGSTGYGEAWFQQNGFKSWRTAIGDIDDGGRWLLKQGISTPDKIAIVGWSYGGYAALQSAVLDPGLFKAVAAVAPVTDLPTLLERAKRYTDYKLVGSQIGTGPNIVQGSPARNAERIQVPVLLFHGDLDVNVELEQSKIMASRLKAANGKVEFFEYKGLDHQLVDDKVRTEMLDKIDTFLADVHEPGQGAQLRIAMRNHIRLGLGLGALAVCASPVAAQFVKYGPAGFFGGYKDKEISPGTWQVSVSPNAASGGGTGATAMANYRAAEIVKQHGFTHMRVLDSKGFELGLTVGSTQRFDGGPGYARLVVRGAKDAVDVDGCLARDPAKCVTVGVDETMDRWRPYISFRKAPLGSARRKRAAPCGTAPCFLSEDRGSARVELDDQIRFHLHRIGHFVQGRHAGEGHLRGAVRSDVIGDVALGEALRFHHQRHFLRLGTQRDLHAREDAARRDVALHAVDLDVAVRDELARGEHGRRELGAVHDHVQALLEQADQVLAGVALHAGGFMVACPELLLGHVAIIALEFLLGAQLDAEIGNLALAALAMLAGAVFALVHRGLWTTPDILAHTAIELVLGAGALRHVYYLCKCQQQDRHPKGPIDIRSSLCR